MAGRQFAVSLTSTTTVMDFNIPTYVPYVGPTAELYLTVSSTATCKVQMQEIGGVWRDFPETTFTGPTAQLCLVKRGNIRLIIETAAQVNVEVFW